MSQSTAAAISPAELEARLRLHGLPGLGPMRFHRLLQAFGGAARSVSPGASRPSTNQGVSG